LPYTSDVSGREEGEFATLNWPLSMLRSGPTCNHKPCILFWASGPEGGRFCRTGEPKWNYTSRSGGSTNMGPNDPGGGPEAGGAPARGAEGASQRLAGGAQGAERKRPKLEAAIPFIDAILEATVRRPESSGTRRTGSGCDCVGRNRKPRWRNRRSVSMCAPGRLPWGCWGMRSLCRNPISSVARRRWIGTRLGRVRRRGPQDLRVLSAQHGQRRRFSPGVSARQSASVSGSARVGVRLFWRRVSRFALRQSQKRREEILRGHQRKRPRGSSLSVRTGDSQRTSVRPARDMKKAAWRAKGPVPAELSGAGAERAAPGGVEPAAGGGSREEQNRVIHGHTQSIGAGMIAEREYLLPLAQEASIWPPCIS